MTTSLKLVFATSNQNKILEIRDLLPGNIEILSLDDIGCEEEIPETSGTIEGNALQKARYVRDHYGYDCFADDTGLEVEALGGRPGVYSARYAGEEKDDAANIQKLLNELGGVEKRNALFRTVMALTCAGETQTFHGICEGHILQERSGSGGFGYDPVFQPTGSSVSFAEMSREEKSRISHRGRATRSLVDFLDKKLNDRKS